MKKTGLYGGKKIDITDHIKDINKRTQVLVEADKETSGRKQLKLPLEGKR